MTTPPRALASVLALTAALLLAASGVHAAPAAPADPADLSLEELLNANVQTASRKSQRLQDVAAAVFVITRDDIERSGATSIPDALRLAPGVHVARIANNRWAVSARGFNGRFANKLLVLMDGRSIYSTLFSGVVWEAEGTLLEDIERIEVIRGPGAALWGANAVNGVINIITRKARDTRGTLAVAAVGSEERGIVALRHGVALGDGHLRVWGKALARDTSVDLAGAPANDDWHDSRLGFRGDWALDASRRITLSGSTYRSRTGDTWRLPSYTSPQGFEATPMRQNANGTHLLARHDWLWADGTEAALQAYLDRADLEVGGIVRDHRSTVDLDFQHRPRLDGAHDVVWGLGYRQSNDHIDSGTLLSVAPASRRWELVSAFVQDEWTLAPKTLRLVLGTRLEHNSFTGFEPQPNLRLIWTPTPQRTLWGALSRAVRTPSRAERDAQVDLTVRPANGFMPAVLVRNVPDPDRPLGNEVVKAVELGLREQVGPQLSLDLVLFHNRYDKLRGARLGAQGFELLPIPHAVQTTSPNNGVHARSQGLELALDWHLSPRWRVQPAYTYMAIDARASSTDPAENASASVYNASAPRHQLSLRASATLANRSQLDLWLRHVSRLAPTRPGAPGIAAHTTLDLRCAWRVRSGLELSVVGQNLLDRQHPEFVPDLLPAQPLQVQRAVLVKAKWQF